MCKGKRGCGLCGYVVNRQPSKEKGPVGVTRTKEHSQGARRPYHFTPSTSLVFYDSSIRVGADRITLWLF